MIQIPVLFNGAPSGQLPRWVCLNQNKSTQRDLAACQDLHNMQICQVPGYCNLSVTIKSNHSSHCDDAVVFICEYWVSLQIYFSSLSQPFCIFNAVLFLCVSRSPGCSDMFCPNLSNIPTEPRLKTTSSSGQRPLLLSIAPHSSLISDNSSLTLTPLHPPATALRLRLHWSGTFCGSLQIAGDFFLRLEGLNLTISRCLNLITETCDFNLYPLF